MIENGDKEEEKKADDEDDEGFNDERDEAFQEQLKKNGGKQNPRFQQSLTTV
jgi:hypothetical protein